ncbi:hypothetical protein RE628_25465 [Paenibacillus sp. D2_2]|uniref:hypothetical protein n=1 Tax=Paenibacillus sp. D2_2 TaxID=3073092 RepID=UPI002815AD73|nr:hypothetical protein [Paenibacillus sp. D2_2]WMT40500.1 hypothetical protein RE628_25465 [Paenibacillus sp. D2_2]
MDYSEIYDLHIQLLKGYASHKRRGDSPFQREINYYRNQLRFAEDVVQRIFVLNQLVKIHEKERENMIKWCSEEYFSPTENHKDSQNGASG